MNGRFLSSFLINRMSRSMSLENLSKMRCRVIREDVPHTSLLLIRSTKQVLS